MSGLIERLRREAASHAILVKNSTIIVFGSGISAIFGFAYWWLAARWLPPEVVGTASGLLSLMGFVGLLGDAGLGTLLVGEIIRWPGRERGLISAVLLAVLFLSLCTGAVILVLSEQIFHLFAHKPLIDLCLIFFGFSLTGLWLVINQTWLGMLESYFRMVCQIVFSTLKLVLLVFAVRWSSDISVILGSWIAALFSSIVLGQFLMRYQNKSFLHRPDFALLASLKSKVVHHYRLDLGMMVPSTVLPYLVTVLLSPSANAVFTVLWMIWGIVVIVPATLTSVLFPAIQAEPHQYRNQMKFSLTVSLLYAVAFGLFIFLFSTDVLRLFNPVYGMIGGTDLRVLGFGMIGSVIKCHICAAARLNNRMREVSVSIFLAGVYELACAVIGVCLGGLEGLAWAWMIAALTESGVLLRINSIYDTGGVEPKIIPKFSFSRGR